MEADKSTTYEYHVGMTCEGCSGAVERVLGKLQSQGVKKVSVDLDAQRVFVEVSNLSPEQILESIKKTGKPVAYVGIKQ